jgi:hypothetical protein
MPRATVRTLIACRPPSRSDAEVSKVARLAAAGYSRRTASTPSATNSRPRSPTATGSGVWSSGVLSRSPASARGEQA